MKEWYLIGNKTKPNMLGGYENQSFMDYKEDAFLESLETDVASTVLLCNSDLSIREEIRCIMQGNVADTQLQSMQRKGLFTRGTVKDGMYIFFEGGYWLIIGFPGTNGIYEKATMSLCQFKLRWQNSDGKIIERWAYTEDFTKYSNGLTGNNTLTIGDNQYGLTLPIDSETKKLKRDMRFPIDSDDSDQPDVYKLTNRKVKLNDNQYFGRGGTMIITMSFDIFNKDKDKKVTMKDGNEVWICNYNDSYTSLPSTLQPLDEKKDSNSPNMENKNPDYNIRISCEGGNYLFAGGEDKTFTAVLTDSHGNQIKNHSIEWSVTIVPGKEKYISYEIAGNNSIMIRSTYDSSIIGQKILLTASALGIQKSIYIDIGGGI